MNDLTYAYIAFDGDNCSIYVMTCFDLLVENFDEFKTIRKMIPEMTMEYHNEFMIVNRMPISMLPSFKILMMMITLNKAVDISDQINFLLLLFRLGNCGQIKKFLEFADIRGDTWRSLMNVEIDVKDFFDDEQKYYICMAMKSRFPEIDDTTYLSFYGVPYAMRTPGLSLLRISVKEFVQYGDMYEQFVSKLFELLPYESKYFPKIKKLNFPQKRMYDQESDSYYQYETFGDKILLLQPRKATVATMAQLGGKRTVPMAAFKEEYIFDKIVENFMYDTINIMHRDRIIKMYLVYSTTSGVRHMLDH